MSTVGANVSRITAISNFMVRLPRLPFRATSALLLMWNENLRAILNPASEVRVSMPWQTARLEIKLKEPPCFARQS